MGTDYESIDQQLPGYVKIIQKNGKTYYEFVVRDEEGKWCVIEDERVEPPKPKIRKLIRL